MIQTDDIELVYAPFLTPGITPLGFRELSAEMPCACDRIREGLCSGCFDRLKFLGPDNG